MAANQHLQAMQTYAALMEEIKVRITTIQKIALNKEAYPAPIVKEMCFLQFRMICELISLGCLVAHGDIQEIKSARFQTVYQADNIANSLQKLHPDFYPRPFKQVNPRPGHFHLEPVAGPHLTKEKMIALNHACGSVLHKGSLKKLLKAKNPTQLSFPEIQDHLQMIVNLLDSHIISLIGGNTILCLLEPAGSGSVQVAYAEPVDGERASS